MGLSLLDLLRNHAARSPDAPCLSSEGVRLSYRELNERGSYVANGLRRRGLQPGDHPCVAQNAPVHFELFSDAPRRLRSCCPSIGGCRPLGCRYSGRRRSDPRSGWRRFRSLLAGTPSRPKLIDLDSAYPVWRDAESPADPEPSSKPDDATLILYRQEHYRSAKNDQPRRPVLHGAHGGRGLGL